jgi:hypothetical protein
MEAIHHLFAVEGIECSNGGDPHTPDRGASHLLGCHILQHSLGCLQSMRRKGGEGGDTDGRAVVSESAKETCRGGSGQDCE